MVAFMSEMKAGGKADWAVAGWLFEIFAFSRRKITFALFQREERYLLFMVLLNGWDII